MNEGNLLKSMNALVTGEGFIREHPVPLSACVATGASAAALSSNVLVITFDADNESITIPFKVPLDYDSTKDELAVVLTALLTTGDESTNAIAVDLDQVKYARPGEDAVTDISSDVTSDSQSIEAAAIKEYVWDLSGLGLKAGDVLSIELDAQEDGTAVATVYGASVKYRTDLVAYQPDYREAITDVVDNS